MVVEREAMDVVEALRQRSTIEKRFKGFDDAESWGARLADIEAMLKDVGGHKPAAPSMLCPRTSMRKSVIEERLNNADFLRGGGVN